MNKPSKFITQLYNILEVFSVINQTTTPNDAIHWTANGKAFVIENSIEFSKSIMELHFNTSNIQSFLRQLGLYGFRMRKNENNQKEYHHKWFFRGNQSQLYKILRKQREQREQQNEALADINLSNINMRSQLDNLKARQGKILLQFQLSFQIYKNITNKVNQIIDVRLNYTQHFGKQFDQTQREQYEKPMINFFSLLSGYLPEVGDPLRELLYEPSDPTTPFHEICNTPLFPFFR